VAAEHEGVRRKCLAMTKIVVVIRIVVLIDVDVSA
jgi:hypothetical protein